MKRPTLNPGELRHDITILRPVAGSDESGSTTNLVSFISARAKIETVRGIDVIRSGQTTTQLFITVSMWWQAGVLPNMHVQAPNGSYVIQSVENLLEMNVVLRLNCLALGSNE